MESTYSGQVLCQGRHVGVPELELTLEHRHVVFLNIYYYEEAGILVSPVLKE